MSDMPTPKTEATRARSLAWYERQREVGWPPFDHTGFDFAEQLERELAEAKAEITGHITEREELGDSYTEMANLYHDAAKQLTAHKAALEKCEKALGDHGTLCSTELRYGDLCDCGLVVAKTEALFEIAKLTSSTSVNPNQPSQ